MSDFIGLVLTISIGSIVTLALALVKCKTANRKIELATARAKRKNNRVKLSQYQVLYRYNWKAESCSELQ